MRVMVGAAIHEPSAAGRPEANAPARVWSALLARLRDDGVAYCLLPSAGGAGEDVDCLVAPRQLQRWHRLLTADGWVAWRPGFDPSYRPDPGWPSDDHMVYVRDVPGLGLVSLDCVHAVGAGRGSKRFTEELLQRRRLDGERWVPDPSDTLVYWLVRAARKGWPERYAARLADGWGAAPRGMVEDRLRLAVGPGRATAILAAWRARSPGDPARPGRSRFGWSVRSRWRSVRPAAVNEGRRHWFELVGPDGCGKSTMAEAVSRRLGLPARCLYLGIQGYRLPWGRLAHRLSTVYRSRTRPGWVARLRERLAAVRELLLIINDYSELSWRLASARRLQRRGWLIVSDRGPSDRVACALAQRRHLAGLEWWLLGHLMPSPTATIHLQASTATLLARSGELSAVDYRRLRSAYRWMARRRRCWVTVSAEGGPETVSRAICRAMLEALATREERADAVH